MDRVSDLRADRRRRDAGHTPAAAGSPTGFAVGQQVMLAGRDGTWRVMAVTPTVLTLAPLAGATLPTSPSIVTAAAVPGPHGGLTVVHGGGNTALAVEVSGTTTAPTAGPLTVARADGLAWSDRRLRGRPARDRRGPGRRLARHRLRQRRRARWPTRSRAAARLAGCSSRPCPARPPSRGSLTDAHVAVVDPRRSRRRARWTSAPAPSPGRPAPGSLTASSVGMAVFISGLAGPWTVAGVTDSTLTLAGAALTPAHVPGLTVHAFRIRPGRADPDGRRLDRAAAGRRRRPRRTRTHRWSIYGDTSQDGLWYSGDPATVDGREFGDKPFNPFTTVPDAENEDDEWVFAPRQPVPQQRQRRHRRPRCCSPAPPARCCRRSDCTIYGGAGDDTISAARRATTSQAAPATTRSSVAAASTTSTATRASTSTSSPARWRIPTSNQSAYPNADPRRPRRPRPDLRRGHSAPSTGSADGLYADIIFGDHGVIAMDVEDPNSPSPKLQRIQTTELAKVLSHLLRLAAGRRRRRGLRRPRPGHRDRRRRRRHARRRRAGRPRLRRQRDRPDQPVHRLHQLPVPDAGRHADLQPHRPSGARRLRHPERRQLRRPPRGRRAAHLPRHRRERPVVGVLLGQLRRPAHGRVRQRLGGRGQLRQRLHRWWRGRRPALRPARQRRHPG